MLTTVRHIFGRIMHSETALCSQWDKGWKNNLLFASPSIRRPTIYHAGQGLPELMPVEAVSDCAYCMAAAGEAGSPPALDGG